MDKLSARIELKMKEDTLAGLNEIYQTHRISPAEVCRALAEAAVAYYRQNGRFGFPINLSEGPITPMSPVTIDKAGPPSLSKIRNNTPGKRISKARQKQSALRESAEVGSALRKSDKVASSEKAAEYEMTRLSESVVAARAHPSRAKH